MHHLLTACTFSSLLRMPSSTTNGSRQAPTAGLSDMAQDAPARPYAEQVRYAGLPPAVDGRTRTPARGAELLEL